jgi:RNA polymerase sigma-70 factor (ECF subfamily)
MPFQTGDDTEIGGEKRTFGSTLWTLVLTARDASTLEAQRALNTLLSLYWKPVYHYIRRRGHDSETAKDFTQDFMTHLLEGSFLAHLEPAQGKFRSYLLRALDHFLSDERDRRLALKRGGGRRVFPMDLVPAEEIVSTEESPARSFSRAWAQLVLDRALQALQKEYEAAGTPENFSLLKAYLANPGKKGSPVYEGLATQFKMTYQEVANRLHRARARLRNRIEDQVRAYTRTGEELQEELTALLTDLS